MLLVVLAITTIRIYYLTINPYPLFMDEAQYWDWARTLEWGYYSKPPMVAWMIALTTSLFGDAEWALRVGSPVAHGVTAIVLYFLANELHSKKAGMLTAITYLLLPAVTVSSSLISTDPFLLLFWSIALFGFVKAMQTDDWAWWLVCGVACGFGLLSKYNFALFAVSILLYLYWDDRFKQTLIKPKIWVAGACAFILFLPNILWNTGNGFVTVLHTKDNAKLEEPLVHIDELFAFLGAQFGVFGPLLFAALLYLLWYGRSHKETSIGKLALAFMLPMLTVITLVSFLSRAHANWAAPIYIAGTIWVVTWVLNHRKEWIIIASLVLHLLASGVHYHYDNVLQATGIELTRKTDPFKRQRGNDMLGEAVTRELQATGATLLSDERSFTALMRYYARPLSFDSVIWNPDGSVKNHYELTSDLKDSEAKRFLLVTRNDHDAMKNPFAQVEKRASIRIPIHSDFVRTFDVYLLHEFQGYR
jgi:4-amino-4-deoxy-L-arabinose transferase-like glycosyltransferase